MRSRARSVAAAVALLPALLLAAAAAPAPAAAQAASSSAQRGPTARTAPAAVDVPPAGFARSGEQVSRTAAREPEVRRERSRRRGTYARPFVSGPPARRRWLVAFFAPTPGAGPNREIAQVVLDDRTGRVAEVWTGDQVAWTMARGYPGAFGRKANDPLVWLGLSLLFVLPFLRRPLTRLHLDLAVLLGFGASYALFNAAEIGWSVAIAVPLLLHILVRCLLIARDRAHGRSPVDRPPLRLALSPGLLALATFVLIGFRVALNLIDGNVIDVGYSGVIGADRLLAGEGIYGTFPPENARGDTYGPVTYYAYVPWAALLPWSGRWDGLPAAHGAAIAFDLAALGLLYLAGRQLRGPRLGVLLAYLWAAFPLTLLVSNSSANDALVSALVLLALLLVARPVGRGAAVAAAGLTKFAPLALAPLLATYRPPGRAGELGSARAPGRPAALTAGALALTAAALLALPLARADPGLILERTVGFQGGRDSPFSLWGQVGLGPAQALAGAAAIGLAVAVAFVPRRRDPVVIAALSAAVLVALQLAVSHWFHLYVVWFLPLVLIAVLAQHAEPA